MDCVVGGMTLEQVSQAMAATGGVCHVPAGRHVLSDTVVFRNLSGRDAVNFRVELHPDAEIVVRPDRDGIVFDGSVNRIGRGHTKTSGIFGGKIWAGANTARTTGRLVSFINTDGLTVENVELRGGRIGIDVQGCWSGNISHCFLVHHRTAIAVHDTAIDICIDRIGLYDTDLDGIIVYNGQNYYCSVMRSYIETLVGNPINQDATSHEMLIFGNFFNDNAGSVEAILQAAGNRVIGNSFTAYHGTGAGVRILGNFNVIGLNVSRGNAAYQYGWLKPDAGDNVIVGNAHDGVGLAINAAPGNVIEANLGVED